MNNDCRNPKVYYVEGGREGGGSAALQDRDGTPIGKCTGLIPAEDSSNADTETMMEPRLVSVRVPSPPLLPSPPTSKPSRYIVNYSIKKKKKNFLLGRLWVQLKYLLLLLLLLFPKHIVAMLAFVMVFTCVMVLSIVIVQAHVMMLVPFWC